MPRGRGRLLGNACRRDRFYAASRFYASRNRSAEAGAIAIRVRAGVKAGELLRLREKASVPKGSKRTRESGPVATISKKTRSLKDDGISYDQSSQFQQLAQNPAAFERYLEERTAVTDDGEMPPFESLVLDASGGLNFRRELPCLEQQWPHMLKARMRH